MDKNNYPSDNSSPFLERVTVAVICIACFEITSLCSENNDWSSS